MVRSVCIETDDPQYHGSRESPTESMSTVTSIACVLWCSEILRRQEMAVEHQRLDESVTEAVLQSGVVEDSVVHVDGGVMRGADET
jgi:hypothetical protein